MTPDHYATLGLSPTSEDVVIRAAYRALMRRYHPDGNASSTAAARSRAINAAYAVLIDPEKRAEYDRVRAAEAWPVAPRRRSPLTAPSRLFAAASVTVLLVLVYLITWSPLSLVEPTGNVTYVQPRIPEISEDVPILPSPAPAPDVAAAPDASDGAVADPQLAEPLPLPTPAPVVASPRFTAQKTVPVVASPRVTAQRAAPVIASPRVTAQRAPPVIASPRLTAQATAPKPRVVKPAPPQPTVAAAPAKPAPSSNTDLANLDRQQGKFYNQSWLRADPAKRAKLQATRIRFLARRDECQSTACTRAAYLDRIREVGEIMMRPNKSAD